MKNIPTFLTLLVLLLGLRPAAQAQSCLPPTSVGVSSAGNPGNNTAVVSFTPSATAVSYTVRYYWVGDSTAAGMMSVNTTTSPVTLTGLHTGAGAYYRVRVVSNCAGGGTATSPWVWFMVGASGGPAGGCGAVTGLALSSNPTATYVSFQPVAGALSYTVRLEVTGNAASARTVVVSGSPATFAGALLPGTAYTATVVTNCASGTPTPTVSAPASIGFTTPPAAGTCGTVSNVQNTAVTPTSATFSFVPVAAALNYTIRYWTGSTGPAQTLTVTGSPVTLTGLQPGSFYGVSIIANCSNGAAPAVAHNFGTTTVANCGAVTNVTMTPTSASTATVNFTASAGNSTFYVYYYVPGDSTRYHSVSSTTAPVVLTGLIPGTTYTIRVVSYCGTSGTLTSGTTVPVLFTFRGALAARAALGTGAVGVFPNPAHRAASLVLPAVPGATQARLTLLNALGQAVRAQLVPLAAAGDTHAQLDLAGVAPGLYTLRVAAGSQAASQRLVVE